MSNLNEHVLTLKDAALNASKVVKDFINNGFKIEMKGPANLVTEADLAAEKIIVQTIKKKFPNHAFLGEEQEKAKIDAEHLWVIDPIDGTTNFSHGVPVVGISIAYCNKGEVLCGAILNPFTDEFYLALKGEGASLNETPIKVSQKNQINESLIATGFYYGLGPHLSSSLKIVENLVKLECHGIRRMGAASIDLCYVARGLYEAYFELKLNAWDFAAGMLLVREAGGEVVNIEGENLGLEDNKVLATNSLITKDVLRCIRENLYAI